MTSNKAEFEEVIFDLADLEDTMQTDYTPVPETVHKFIGELTADINDFTTQFTRLVQGDFSIASEEVGYINDNRQAITLTLADGSLLQLDLEDEQIYRKDDGGSQLHATVLIGVENPKMSLEQLQGLLSKAKVNGFTLITSNWKDEVIDGTLFTDVTLENLKLDIGYLDI